MDGRSQAEYDSLQTPPAKRTIQKFGVRRRTATVSTPVIENARDGVGLSSRVTNRIQIYHSQPDFDFDDTSPPVNGKYINPKARPLGAPIMRPGTAIMQNDEQARLSKMRAPPTRQDPFLNGILSKKNVVKPGSTLGLEAISSSSTRAKEWKSTVSPLEAISSTQAKGSPLNLQLKSKRRTSDTSLSPQPTQSHVTTRGRLNPSPSVDSISSSIDALSSSKQLKKEGTVASRYRESVNGRLPIRKSRRLSKEKKIDGTADQPIHLGDSETEEEVEQKEENDEKEDYVYSLKGVRVWFGTQPCLVDVYGYGDRMWLCSIKGVGEKWTYPHELEVPYKSIRSVDVCDNKRCIGYSIDSIDPVERLMVDASFLAMRFPFPKGNEWKNSRDFYDPASKDIKRFVVFVSYDDKPFGVIEDILKAHGNEINYIYTLSEGSSRLEAVIKYSDHFKQTTPRTGKRRKRIQEGDDIMQFTYPLPPCSIDIVTITKQDIGRLQPEQYLNDNLIDYYFKRLILVDFQQDLNLIKNVLFLSSHFYSRLCMGKGTTIKERMITGYQNVSTWLTRSDFFNRSMVFIPINKDMHWSMAVIINARRMDVSTEDDPSLPRCCIAVLDPLGTYHCKSAILRHLRAFLAMEWKRTQGSFIKCTSENIIGITVKAPQQQNSYDCGVYILQYAHVILTQYQKLGHGHKLFQQDGMMEIPNDMMNDQLASLLPVDAFTSVDIRQKRIELIKLVTQDTNEYEQIVNK